MLANIFFQLLSYIVATSPSPNFFAPSSTEGVVSSCTGTQKKETLTNCVITPCMVMKTKGIPSCTGTPGQPHRRPHP